MPNVIRAVAIAAVACLGASLTAGAYLQHSHARIARAAIARSVLNDPGSKVLWNLRLGDNAFDRRFLLPYMHSTANGTFGWTPSMLIAQGAIDEDDEEPIFRAVDHFFDPQFGGKGLFAPGFDPHPSPAWILEDEGQIDTQEFSFVDARNDFYLALTGPSRDFRNRKLSMVFQIIGHLIHHLQDMAQPQHTRNDLHCDNGRCKKIGIYNPSDYEAYTGELGNNLPFDDSYPVPDYIRAPTPRALWTNHNIPCDSIGCGIADFSSKNFVSSGTNFQFTNNSPSQITVDPQGHPRPDPSGASIVARNIVDPDMLGVIAQYRNVTGVAAYVETNITDDFAPSFGGVNRATSAMGVFGPELVINPPMWGGAVNFESRAGFTLTSINYRAAAERLIPRAAAYSVSMINYFFRGRLEISLPAEHTFSMVDGAATQAGGAGFKKVKMRVKNTTVDGPISQDMSDGTLIAVAKYTINPCYQPNLSGEALLPGPSFHTQSGCDLDTYLGPVDQDEIISVSDEHEHEHVSLQPGADPSDFMFDFSAHPIPLNARDIRIQVIYRGRLGEEDGGIALGAVDISAPTWYVMFNSSDYYSNDGHLTPASPDGPYQAESLYVGSIWLSGDYNDPDLAGRVLIPAKSYIRLAFLLEKDQQFVVTTISGWGPLGLGAYLDLITQTTIYPTSKIDTQSPLPVFLTLMSNARGMIGENTKVMFKSYPPRDPMLRAEFDDLLDRVVPDLGPTPVKMFVPFGTNVPH